MTYEPTHPIRQTEGRQTGLWSDIIRQPPLGAQTLHAAEAPLRRIIAKQVSPIVLVTGLRNDYRSLEQLADSSGHEKRWLATPASRVIDRQSAIFAFRSDKNSLGGITWQDVAECYLGNGVPAKLLFVGDSNNVNFAAEAIKSIIPHFPVAVAHLNPKKPATKVGDRSAHGISPVILSTQATQSEIDVVISGAATQCLDSAALAASQLLSPVNLINSGDPIPKIVYDCLKKKLIPGARDVNLHILLRGGCGIVAFMPYARPISLDIDFTALLKVEQFDRFKELMRGICEGGRYEVRGCPSLTDPKRSTYLKGKLSMSGVNGPEVSLDAVSVRRVAGELFFFEFKYDKVVNRYHRIARLDSGETIGVVAPELNLIEKLVAGRGRAQEKYDILDATGILANQHLEFYLIQRIIERQRFDNQLDGNINIRELRTNQVDRQLQELGILSDLNLRLVVEKALHNNNLFSRRHNALREAGEVYHILTQDSLKKVALVNKLLRALDEVERNMYEVDNRLVEPASPADLWGSGKIIAGVSNLRKFLYSYTEHDLLRKNLYIKRNSRSLERAQDFWNEDSIKE